MRVFLDASALVPLQVARDHWADRVQVVLRTLVPRDPEFVTTNWTLYEALALAARFGHYQARSLFARVGAFGEQVPVGEDVEREALKRFLTWSDKSASVVDHANLLVAVDEGCDAILSFDEDFAPLARQAGIRLLR